MTIRYLGAISALLFAVVLSSCGGAGGGGLVAAASSGGGSGGGIGGTGLTSSGTISGFGSIFVNGVEFETDGAEILLDGRSVTEDALGLGMVVLVTGTISDNGTNGIASRIVFDDEVQGPVLAILRAADGDSMLVTVLDNKVIVERTGTVFKGVAFDALALGDLVEVSGFADTQGRLRATRLEKKDDFQAGISAIELKGIVSDLVGTEFRLRGYTVDFAAADLSGVPAGVLADGMQVELEGTLDPATQRITAARVEQESGLDSIFDAGKDLDVEGVITGFVSATEFRVNGVPVDASNASLNPSDLVLGNGAIVEAEGVWENSMLRARSIEARRGRVEIEAAVAKVDSVKKTLTLQLQGGTVSVQVDSRTMLDDDTDRVDRLALADIRPGDFLDIEALRQGATLVATRVDREKTGDDVLQGGLEAFNAGDSVAVLGLTYSTVGAQFRSLAGLSLTAEQFYAGLETGALVKVRDRAPADGIADSVELEYEGTLDGERDFDEEDKVDKGDDEADEVDGGDDEADDQEDGGDDQADDQEDGGDDQADDQEDGGDDQADDQEDQPDEPEPEEEQPEAL